MNILSSLKRRSAFTLAEMSVVVVILGTLATIALPRYLIHRKVMCNQEAITILKALFDAQTDYRRDHGSFTDNADNLAIAFDGQSSCFNDHEISLGEGKTCGAAFTSIASIEAADNSYTLHISDTGNMFCLPCDSSVCIKMGF